MDHKQVKKTRTNPQDALVPESTTRSKPGPKEDTDSSGGKKTQGEPFDYIGALTALPEAPTGLAQRVIVIERLVVIAESGLQTPTYRVVPCKSRLD